MTDEARLSVTSLFTMHPDFPKPGINFCNVLPLWREPRLVRVMVEAMADAVRALPSSSPRPTFVAGIESRGFIFAPQLAEALNLPFVAIRKAGKLPGAVVTHTYDLEYGSASIQVAKDAVREGDVGVVCDDLLATGGTAAAALALLRELGASAAAVVVIVDLAFLEGAKRLAPTPTLAITSL
jgi:adenine phosphoribosyltransferase